MLSNEVCKRWKPIHKVSTRCEVFLNTEYLALNKDGLEDLNKNNARKMKQMQGVKELHVSLGFPPGLRRNQGWGFRADTYK